jgi:hypothetical protein
MMVNDVLAILKGADHEAKNDQGRATFASLLTEIYRPATDAKLVEALKAVA